MADDEHLLGLSRELMDVVIAEVKTNQPCSLNGPWTRPESQNVHRVLAAIRCLPTARINGAAADIYRAGIHASGTGLRIRLVAVGRERSRDLIAQYPNVAQLIWPELLAFIWDRFRTYRNQKTQVDQWDVQGRKIKRLADQTATASAFTEDALRLMGGA